MVDPLHSATCIVEQVRAPEADRIPVAQPGIRRVAAVDIRVVLKGGRGADLGAGDGLARESQSAAVLDELRWRDLDPGVVVEPGTLGRALVAEVLIGGAALDVPLLPLVVLEPAALEGVGGDVVRTGVEPLVDSSAFRSGTPTLTVSITVPE